MHNTLTSNSEDKATWSFIEPALYSKMEVARIKHQRLGILPAPTTLLEIWAILAEWKRAARLPTLWRGQADIDWMVDSGIVRSIRSKELLAKNLPNLTAEFKRKSDAASHEIGPLALSIIKAVEELQPVDYETHVAHLERQMLDQFRGQGWDVRAGSKEMSESQIFAVLQHHGAATRFLDFTQNVLIGAWFASIFQLEHVNKCGFLLGLNLKKRSSSIQSLSDSILLKDGFENVFKVYPDATIFTWSPTRLYERMRMQQSVLVFSRNSRPGTWSSLSDKNFAEDCESELFSGMAITPDAKETLVGEFSQLGYDHSVLFPDLEGFSKYFSATANDGYLDILSSLMRQLEMIFVDETKREAE